MLHPELEQLIREAWMLVAAEMGPAFNELSWLKAPKAEASSMKPVSFDEDLPLAA